MSELTNLDCREYGIIIQNKELIIYQIEILRIIKILESANSNKIAMKFRRMIYLRDIKEGTKTDFNKDLGKCEASRYILANRAFNELTRNQREIDKNMERYYNGKKT